MDRLTRSVLPPLPDRCNHAYNRGSYSCDVSGNLACDGRCWQHCEYGLEMARRQRMLSSVGYQHDRLVAKLMELHEEWNDHRIEVHGHADNREKKTANGKYNGPFAFTLTMSPDDGITVDEMLHAARAIMEQRSQPVRKYAWYLEYKDEETKKHPHIHGMYETVNGRRIEKKHWMRKWRIWDESSPLGMGFRGGYHRPVRFDEAYSDYIKKQGGIGDSHGV